MKLTAYLPGERPADQAELGDCRDPLTGLLNAAGALAQLDTWCAAAKLRGERSFVHAMLLRLGNFPAVNLAHGAQQGDAALSAVAERLLCFTACELGMPSLVARVAGDSFLLAANQPLSRERWQWLAEALATIVARPIVTVGVAGDAKPIRLRPRLALSRAIPDELTGGMLARLFEALEMGQGRPARRPVWVDGTLSPLGRSGGELETDLVAALERGEIEILYQPQYACADGRIVGAEALARWRHPQIGLIGAESLFAIADRGDQVARVSRHILRAALIGAGRWPAPLGVSINVTAADLLDTGYAARVTQTLKDTGFDAARLTLEITETVLLHNLDRSARTLERLKAAGVHIALDDFGAGFCNFRYLKLLPIDCLKLDRSMVQGVPEDPRDLAVLQGMMAMAAALELEVVAEGIEDAAQRDIVAREGCARWQGFLGAQPMAEGEFLDLIDG